MLQISKVAKFRRQRTQQVVVSVAAEVQMPQVGEFAKLRRQRKPNPPADVAVVDEVAVVAKVQMLQAGKVAKLRRQRAQSDSAQFQPNNPSVAVGSNAAPLIQRGVAQPVVATYPIRVHSIRIGIDEFNQRCAVVGCRAGDGGRRGRGRRGGGRGRGPARPLAPNHAVVGPVPAHSNGDEVVRCAGFQAADDAVGAAEGGHSGAGIAAGAGLQIDYEVGLGIVRRVPGYAHRAGGLAGGADGQVADGAYGLRLCGGPCGGRGTGRS